MVGVAGKSKGCVTCKKRRIKCDEGKPRCRKCDKSGYACGGYKTDLQFVNTSTAPLPKEPDQSSSKTTYINNTPVRVVPRIRTATVPTGLSLIAFQSDVCLSYMLQNFVWRTYGTGWLEPAAQKSLDSLSSQAVTALSSSFFGVSHHQEDIQLTGSMQYGNVLGRLRPALADPRKPGFESLIIPILILLMHASYEEDQSAAIAHVKGLMMVLHMAGPRSFQREPVRSAFESARATLTTSFLIARQPLFLAHQDWKTIPWELDPWCKSEQNILADILVDVPGFLADDTKLQQHDDILVHVPGFLADDTKLQQHADTPAHTALLQRVESSLSTLYIWRFTWEIANPTAAYETSSPTTSPPNRRVIARRLLFRTHSQAAEILLYNAIQMWLIGLLLRLSPTTASSTISAIATLAAAFTNFPNPISSGALRLPHDTHSLRDPAIEICRAFEFQITAPEQNKQSSLFFLFPLGIAWPVLEREDAYRAWMREMLDSWPVTRGYAIGRNKWFGKYYLPKVFGRRRRYEGVL
ncbi:hypothetical protein BDV95DRAFT_620481 [Massariosphaeria phaeospora]|uniref:Zn(2)-C6 fungal-type domain-containing protein n=1 Tax=Massariosphaeria phaeospora TaxID=100035 RepID=A0A7C8I3J1_9PLEO|nr:hypothetical protein BDV95DRAFT_620481 [Massariosphaeria phaeospora]